ncbi:MAG: hypothetical protein ACJ74Q_06505 [Pyrinomonadaceae bacterium]|jgi:hypothetical protein
MRPSSKAGFRKLLTCPQTEALLRFSRGDKTQISLATHVKSCDFCGAETQLLSRFPPPANALPFAVLSMPAPLRLLAQEILSEPSFNRARFADSIMEIERMTLTDA